MNKIQPFQSRVGPVTVPAATATVNKHVFLVEIDWDTGTEGYSYERIRTPNLEYLDMVESISPIERSCSPFGAINFPSTTITLRNLDLYFSKKLHNTQHRGRLVRIKVLPPSTAVSHATIVMQGKISGAKMAGGLLSLEIIGHDFEEILGPVLSEVLPVLDRSKYPNLPVDQVPTLIPLLYGEITGAGGEDLENPTANGAIPAVLIDTAGISSFDWTDGTPAALNDWKDVAWSAELAIFCAVAANGPSNVMTSPDGVTWTSRTPASNTTWNGIAWSPELLLFAAVAVSSEIMTSPDGITWTSRTSPTAAEWRGVCWSPELTLFVAVGATGGGGNRVMTSPDGVTWTDRAAASAYDWNHVAWSPELNLFAAVSGSGFSDKVMTSSDGITWTSRVTPKVDAASNTPALYKIVWSPELGVFLASGVRIFLVSANGTDWLSSPLPADAPLVNWTALAWSPDLHLFAAAGSDAGGEGLITSENAVDWTVRVPSADQVWAGMAWSPANGIFVAVAASDVMTSPSTLTNLYRYAVGARPILGDFNSWIEDPAKLSLVYRFGEKVSYKKTVSSVVFGNHTISVIGFAVDQRAGSSAFPDEAERGPDTDAPEISFYGTGVAEGDNVSASAPLDSHIPIRNPVRMKEDFLITYSSTPESFIDQLSHDAAKTAAAEQHLADAGTGGVAAPALGAVIDEMNAAIKSIIEKIDASFALITFQSRNGNLGTLVSPIGALPTPSVIITDEADILEGSFAFEDSSDIATGIHAVYSFRYTQNQHGDPSPGNQFARFCPNYEIPGAKKALRMTASSGNILKEITLHYCRRTATVINVLRAYSEYLRPGAQFVQFGLPVPYFDDIDIGTYINLTHWQGSSAAGGYNATTVRTFGVALDPNPLSPSLSIRAFRRAPGVVVHDNFDRTASASLGSSWTELEDSTAHISIADVSGQEGGTFNQKSALSMYASDPSALGSSAAYWDATTEDDQVASLEIVYRETASNQIFGVAARMSGTVGNFTGYVGLLKFLSAGPTATLSLRKYSGSDLGSAEGTEIGTYTLTVKSFSPNTWRNQGDILELRCISNRIELFFWSDIPENNVGRAIAVTDGDIASGKFGVFVDKDSSINPVYVTNFYGRGIV